jgi:hypothetical protein
MEMTCFVIDDFYIAPDVVRNFALTQEFKVTGNFPGSRTRSFWTDDVRAALEHFMPWAGRITNTYGADQGNGYCGAFQIATARDRTWIHSDPNNMWAAVCYLTPDAPHTGGTGLFRWKDTGEMKDVDHSNKFDGYDYTKWDMVDKIGNKYNRLIVYRGDLYHASLDYFGNNLENGRLFQTFFFDTERRI